MPEFLTLLDPAAALDSLLRQVPVGPLGTEVLPAAAALGRVVAADVTAVAALPGFTRSSVDGYAVNAADTFGVSETLPAYLRLLGEVRMGAAPDFRIAKGGAALIHTGGMLPEGADSVVMLEYTQLARPDEIEILRPVAAGENVLLAGEDVRPGQLLIPRGRILRPAEIGGLMAQGMTAVTLARQPRVVILSSGDEVVTPDQEPAPGQVRDINSYSLAALVQKHGGVPVLGGIVPDSAAALAESLDRFWEEADLILVTAGSSASARDFTAQVIDQLGQPGVLVHGVNVRPGKPTILAVCAGKPVIGLPGNPVSALVIAELFVAPLLHHLLGRSLPPVAQVPARLTANLPSQAGREEYHPVRLVQQGGETLAEPIYFKSNLIFTLAGADGLVKIPADDTGLAAGTMVAVRLML
jgi:molybdopterin molybdotransferase